MKKFFYLIGLFLAVIIVLPHSSAVAGVTGRLKGRVVDKATRGPLAGVTVRIEGTWLETVTNDNGEFYFMAVEAGEHKISISMDGNSYSVIVVVQSDIVNEIDIAASEVPESDGTSKSTTLFSRPHSDPYRTVLITKKDLATRPYRNVTDMVTNSTSSIYQRNGTPYVRAGASGEMGFFLNGITMNDGFAGNVFLTLPYGAIDHLEVNTGGFDAKYGNYGSGITQIVPKRGGHTFYASAEYVTDAASSALGSESYGRNVYSVAFGGPIIRNTLHFFAAGDLSDTDDANPGVFGHPVLRYSTSGIRNPDPTLNDTVFFGPYKRGPRPGLVNSERLTNLYGNISYSPASFIQVDAMTIYSFSKRNLFRNPYLLMPGREPHRERSAVFAVLQGKYDVSKTIYAKVNAGFYSTKYDEIQRDLFKKGDDALLLLNTYTRGNTGASTYFGDNLIYDIERGSIVFKKSESEAMTAGLEFGWQHNDNNFIQIGFQSTASTVRVYDLQDPGYPYGGSNNFYGYRVVSSPGHFKLEHQNSDDFAEGTDGAKRPVHSHFYLQDEVLWETLKLRLGLRGDLFDPGTKIIKDISYPTGPDQQLGPEDFKSSGTELRWSPRINVSARLSDEASAAIHYGWYRQMPPYSYYYVGMDFLERQSIAPPFSALIGNSALKLQKTELIDLSFNYKTRDLLYYASGSLYRKNITNVVGNGNITSFPNGLHTYGNYDKGYVTGIEISLGGKANQNTSIGIDASFLDTRISGSGDNSGFRPAWLGYSDVKLNAPMDQEQSETFRFHALMNINRGEGPGVSGIHPFENVSLYVFGNWQSGFPYTPVQITKYALAGVPSPRAVARRNSRNMPSTFSVDMKLTKQFEFSSGFRTTLYVEILNLLDRKNVIDVFNSTGKPNEDGFLGVGGYSMTARELQQYRYVLNDNFHYSVPRLVYMGLKLEF